MVEHILSTSLVTHISFARIRLTRAAMASLLPEVFLEKDPFDKATLELLNREMLAHNSALDLGQLVLKADAPQPTRKRFGSLDEYVLHMHADKILLVMESLVKFGERVVPLIREDETARAWYLNEHILIQSHHWRVLARRVVNLVKQLGLLTAEEASGAPESRLDNTKLVDAGRRAVEIYGVYLTEGRDASTPKKRKRIVHRTPQSGGNGENGSAFETNAGKFCNGCEESNGFSSDTPESRGATPGAKDNSLKRSKPTPTP